MAAQIYEVKTFSMETPLNLTNVDKNWKPNFTNLCIRIQSELEKQEFYSKLRLLPIDPEIAQSLGYTSKIFKIKNIPGYIRIWLDNYANHKRPRISITYENKDLKYILSVSKKLQNFDKLIIVDKSKIRSLKGSKWILQKPLLQKHLDKFLIESYGKENYLTVFLSDKITNRAYSNELISKISMYISLITRILISFSIENSNKETITENDRKIDLHITRERKIKFKENAKYRDNYTCKICCFNANRKYGNVAFAALEVHHIQPLYHSNKIVKTTLNDLITLCSNCHSMLHKLGGTKQQIIRLKNIINGKARV